MTAAGQPHPIPAIPPLPEGAGPRAIRAALIARSCSHQGRQSKLDRIERRESALDKLSDVVALDAIDDEQPEGRVGPYGWTVVAEAWVLRGLRLSGLSLARGTHGLRATAP